MTTSATATSKTQHPAADVFRSQLLIEVGEENRKLKAELARLQQCREYLGGIELHLGGGGVVTTTFAGAVVVEDFSGLPTLYVPIDAAPQPLSEFGRGTVKMAGQPIGSLPGVDDPIVMSTDVPSKTVKAKLVFSPAGLLEGEIRGLHRKDLLRFKQNVYGEEQLMRFLKQGHGLRNPAAVTFEPKRFYLVIADNLRETIRALGITGRIQSLETMKRLPIDPSASIAGPGPSPVDEARHAIVEAIGSAEQIELVEENVELKDLRHRFLCAEERIGDVELYKELSHDEDEAPQRFSLRDGKLTKNDANGESLMWELSLGKKSCPVTANNIHFLNIAVSGVCSYLRSLDIERGDDQMAHFFGTFGTGATIAGRLLLQSCPEMANADDFDEQVEDFLAGRRPFPWSLVAVVTSVAFPLNTVQKALNLIGVEYSRGGSRDVSDEVLDKLQALQL